MNPLHYGIGTVAQTEISAPSSTAEKISKRLNELSRERDQQYDRETIYRIEREGAEAVRILSEEIDALKLEITSLREELKGLNGRLFKA